MTHSNVAILTGKETSSEKLGNLIQVNFKMRIWSGKVKLTDEEESETTGGEIIASKYKEAGSKVITDPKKLSEFNSFRTSVECYLDNFGPRFQGNWIVNKEDAEVIAEGLQSRIKTFEDKADHYARNHALFRVDWLDKDEDLNLPKNRKLKSIISGVDVSSTWVRNRFRGSVAIPLEVRPYNTGDNDQFENDCEAIIGDMTDSVFRDVSKLATEILAIWNKSSEKSGRVPWKQKSTKVFDLRTKLHSARFIDKAAWPLVLLLDEITQCAADLAYIDGALLSNFLSFFSLVADEDKARTYGEGMLVLQETEKSVKKQQQQNLLATVSASTENLVDETESSSQDNSNEVDDRQNTVFNPVEAEATADYDVIFDDFDETEALEVSEPSSEEPVSIQTDTSQALNEASESSDFDDDFFEMDDDLFDFDEVSA